MLDAPYKALRSSSVCHLIGLSILRRYVLYSQLGNSSDLRVVYIPNSCQTRTDTCYRLGQKREECDIGYAQAGGQRVWQMKHTSPVSFWNPYVPKHQQYCIAT
jgi:hypothetical protein